MYDAQAADAIDACGLRRLPKAPRENADRAWMVKAGLASHNVSRTAARLASRPHRSDQEIPKETACPARSRCV
jgi:hypothetical protein